MNCPYCDSRVSPVPDNRVCPHCGGALSEPGRLEFPEPPLRMYKKAFGYMELQERGVKFYEKLWLNPETSRFIPYDEIVEVAFCPATINGKLGYLSVRGLHDRHIPMVSTSWEAAGDLTSAIFNAKKNEEYSRVYEFLKQCAEIANKARESQGGSL